MKKKESKLQDVQVQAQEAINEVNAKIDELGCHAEKLCEKLNELQAIFDAIRDIPSENRLQYERLGEVRLNWKKQASAILDDYRKAEIENMAKGVIGAGAGVVVATLGPTAAMGIATTFGVASTGAAIATLSGAAATNAALAWLGGGAIAVGGGGMAAGNAFLALAGPIGWAIAGVMLLGSGVLYKIAKNKQYRLEDIYELIGKRDTKTYNLSVVEINERINQIKKGYDFLDSAISRTISFGLDYSKMTDAQKYELGTYVNIMEASTQLLINPIKGLQPKYSEVDYEKYIRKTNIDADNGEKLKPIVISLGNLLYRINLDEKDRQILWKSLRKNEEFLTTMKLKKKEFNFSIFEIVDQALSAAYEENIES